MQMIQISVSHSSEVEGLEAWSRKGSKTAPCPHPLPVSRDEARKTAAQELAAPFHLVRFGRPQTLLVPWATGYHIEAGRPPSSPPLIPI